MHKFLILLVPFVLAVAIADDDGQYKPGSYGGDDGQYHPGDEGKYGGESGAYKSQGASGRLAISASQNAPSYNNQFVNRFIVDTAASNVSPFRSAQSKTYTKPIAVAIVDPVFKPSSHSSRSFHSAEGQSRILHQDSEVNPNSYRYNFETENNIVAEETGSLVNVGTKDEGIKATGFYEYIGPDNVKYRVDYVADENGFRAVGDHLPTPPSV